jgi:DNA-binding XRE family transcriptional regulator
MQEVEKFRVAMTEAREKNNLSKSDLAREISKSPSFICDIESKRKNPSLETAIDIAKALNLSMDKIYNLKLRSQRNKEV